MGFEDLNPFSIAGDIFGGYGAIKSAQTQADTAEKNRLAEEEARKAKQDAITAGTISAHGLTEGRPGGVGTPIVQSIPKGTPFGKAIETGGVGAEQYAGTAKRYGDVSEELVNKFKSGYPSAILDPLTLPQAEGMVTKTQNRFRDQLADAYKPLATQAIRTAGDISGVGDTGLTGPGNQVASFLQNMKKHLPYDPMEARRMVEQSASNYAQATGGVGGQALTTSGQGYLPANPNPLSFTSALSPMMQMPKPAQYQSNMAPYAGAGAMQNIFSNIAAEQDLARQQENYDKLLKVFASRLGDQPAGAISPS